MAPGRSPGALPEISKTGDAARRTVGPRDVEGEEPVMEMVEQREIARDETRTSEPNGTRVDVVGVEHHAGGRQVLHDVSLTIGRGELVAVAGGSGAGKTTLLRLMAGLSRPHTGVVLHDGVRADSGHAAPNVGYVPQDDIIHRELPLRRTLRFAA